MKKRIIFSEKIVLLSFVLSIGVVYQHTKLSGVDSNLIMLMKDFIFYLVETCVPMFFMISGYLFFRTFTWDKILYKYKSRIRTLFVPYIIWNIIYAVFMIGLFKLHFIQELHVPNSAVGVLIKILNAEFSPLWFVKYLMVFVLISPIIYLILKNRYIGVFIILLMMGYNVYAYKTGIMVIPLNVNANNITMYNYQLIFYAIGSYAAMHLKNHIEVPSKRKSYVALTVIIGLCLLYFIWIKNNGNVITSHLFWILFSISLWFAFDMINNIKVKWWMRISFFIYCAHLIPLQSIQGISAYVVNRFIHNPIIRTVIGTVEYMFLPIIVVLICALIAKLLKKYTNPFWSIITGSRG